jgi:internalin A
MAHAASGQQMSSIANLGLLAVQATDSAHPIAMDTWRASNLLALICKRFANLHSLSFSNIQFMDAQLPDSIRLLTNLSSLSLHNNAIRTIPCTLSRLVTLEIKNNPNFLLDAEMYTNANTSHGSLLHASSQMLSASPTRSNATTITMPSTIITSTTTSTTTTTAAEPIATTQTLGDSSSATVSPNSLLSLSQVLQSTLSPRSTFTSPSSSPSPSPLSVSTSTSPRNYSTASTTASTTSTLLSASLSTNSTATLPATWAVDTYATSPTTDAPHMSRMIERRPMALELMSESLLHLTLSHNQLSEVPNAIFLYLTNLQSLNLSHNRISQLPNEIGLMTRLRSLDVAHNSLMTLPLSLSFLKDSLQRLNINANHFVESELRNVRLGDAQAVCR